MMRPVSVGLLYHVDDSHPFAVDDPHVQEWYGSIFLSFDSKSERWMQTVHRCKLLFYLYSFDILYDVVHVPCI